MNWPTLRRDKSRGDDVKMLQGILRAYGLLADTIDGIFGSNTENAVKQFQRKKSLSVDGIVGQATWTVLLLGPLERFEGEIIEPGGEVYAPSKPLATSTYSPDVAKELDALWATMKLTATDRRFDWYVDKSLAHKDRYQITGWNVNPLMPWWFVAVIHGLEASFDFSKHLHNGDPLSSKTVNVPKGRIPGQNPPYTWEESAHDALTMPGKQYDKAEDWSMAAILWRLEGYNGYGYRMYRGIHSPYLWAGTNHYTRGKYTSDGVWSSTAVSKQAGAAGVIKLLL